METSSTATKTKYKTRLKLLCFSLIVLVILRLLAPFFVQQIANRSLQNAEGITGSIGDVDLQLYRGAYNIQNIAIYAIDLDNNKKPLLSIKQLDLSLLWSALFSGNIVTKMQIQQPEIVIYDNEPDVTPTDEHQKLTNEDTWIGLANDIVLFSIDKVSISDGKITLINSKNEDQTNTYISDLHGQATNITNSQELSKSLASQFTFTGKLMGESSLKLKGQLDTLTKKANFDFNAEMQRFPIQHIDSAIKFYTPFDIEAGAIDGAMELVCKDGQIDGYLKAGIYDLNVFSWREDIEQDDDGPLTFIFENTMELFGNILENNDSDLVAARIPISGTLDNAEVSTLATLISLIKNAFVEAFEMKVDNIISFEKNEIEEND
ncbi:DUF748 domain-containing protein [Catenovulum adriaticum]|uniref:DUF748 domain-containing protein n=1 Tax=Catenovulum adriaticum TaxID=2984846 RepID=A0ABY7AT09_9ALTE|nr:DUF748 domain-containing protein [Catenovulum sp. TS8]WAJ72407.1 DUF748 domain-containing protein [Catenovulum sp. TS8]